ncbi:SPOR domain-containing protein [Leucothrix pacifica]|uniref:SPOR domain-containing protein n=1 Tax=Leucothrix pacifica TaxID=1247513 RepID=A0A317C3L6_9GAMM|nr:SPOR domain-containing protein [Leucothrix pacifica]PWQ92869.1 hypothetical protein DKW60_19185 [Leucothrix pacifica]
MNRTTVKRGIGAVILALIAAALLALLLKDKAAQRQDVVDMALPGTTEGSIESSGSSTRLPQLSTDNSGNGTVIAQAGQEAVSNAATTATDTVAQTGTSVKDAASNAAGNVIASATAVGATAAATVAASGEAAGDAAQKTIDFSVRAPQKASEEFRELDLVNNGDATAPAATSVAATTSNTQASQTVAQESVTAAPAKPDQGTVIASTSARQAAPSTTRSSGGGQARLIDEKRTAAPKSSRTTQVVRQSAPAKPAPKATEAAKPAPAATSQAKNGYAIQLLATSSSSRANDLKNVMAGEGYPTYVTRTQQNGKLLYRVRIGQYSNRTAAANAQAAMKRRYKKNTYVNRSAIVAR